MRGKLTLPKKTTADSRNIPAYAGKTCGGGHWRFDRQEHPRVCGENSVDLGAALGKSGTSPRMRGKQEETGRPPRRSRNIPAYAGKTRYR